MTLDKYTLHKDQKSDRWRLEKEGSNRAKRTFDTKEDALKNLRGAVGPHGGSVRIRKVDGCARRGGHEDCLGMCSRRCAERTGDAFYRGTRAYRTVAYGRAPLPMGQRDV